MVEEEIAVEVDVAVRVGVAAAEVMVVPTRMISSV